MSQQKFISKSIQLPEETWGSLEAEAQSENISVAAVIRRTIINPRGAEELQKEIDSLKLENFFLKKDLETEKEFHKRAAEHAENFRAIAENLQETYSRIIDLMNEREDKRKERLTEIKRKHNGGNNE